MRFGVYILPDTPFDEFRARCRAAEALGFDQLWTADHTTDFRRPGAPWFDCFVTLAVAAQSTERVRLGPLVANPIVRTPQLLAREAHALDHLSGGRAEIGIGTGIAGFDHRAMGSEAPSARARVRRFAEYVEVVDVLLRSDPGGVEHGGDHYRAASPPLNPPTPQRPRPPILIGGQAPTVLRTAARLGDVWNTHGPFGAAFDDIVDITRRQNRELDEMLSGYGRAPDELRRSVLLYGPLELWTPGVDARDRLQRTGERFAAAGTREFILSWPPDVARTAEFERLATDVIPGLRG